MNPKKLSIESFWLPVKAPVIAKLSEHIDITNTAIYSKISINVSLFMMLYYCSFLISSFNSSMSCYILNCLVFIIPHWSAIYDTTVNIATDKSSTGDCVLVIAIVIDIRTMPRTIRECNMYSTTMLFINLTF